MVCFKRTIFDKQPDLTFLWSIKIAFLYILSANWYKRPRRIRRLYPLRIFFIWTTKLFWWYEKNTSYFHAYTFPGRIP